MPVHRGNLRRVVNEAWKRASGGAKEGPDKQRQNACRSKKWVNKLAEGFRGEYPRRYRDSDRKTPYRVFWKGGKDNKEHFRRHEFLFDLMVCSVSETESLQRHSNRLEFIDRCHWQVESEFNRSDTRELVIDMSKLVLGSAENKLFVVAHRERNREELRGICGVIASRCDGNVYLAFVAHPDDWAKKSGGRGKQPEVPKVYEWLAGDWVSLGNVS